MSSEWLRIKRKKNNGNSLHTLQTSPYPFPSCTGLGDGVSVAAVAAVTGADLGQS